MILLLFAINVVIFEWGFKASKKKGAATNSVEFLEAARGTISEN